MRRDFLDLRECSKEDFLELLDKHDFIIVKPASEAGGAGLEKLSSDEAKNQYDRLIDQGKYVVEEVAKQHSKMDLINSSSVNTLRICTCINDDGEASILFMALKIGRKGSFIDNLSAGGFYTKLSMDGVITHPCYTSQDYGKVYTHHPDTGMEFIGFQVPMIEEVKDFALALARKNPEARYVGWDIAIAQDGPVLIEGNERPGVNLAQTYIHSDTRTGMRDQYEKVLSVKL